jgi:hypothetical protein
MKSKQVRNDKLAILESIAKGERAIKIGRVLSNATARKRMARWLK